MTVRLTFPKPRLPGVELVDLPNADWCCGSAGVYNLTHPGMADEQLRGKLDSIERVSAEQAAGFQAVTARFELLEQRVGAAVDRGSQDVIDVVRERGPRPPGGSG